MSQLRSTQFANTWVTLTDGKGHRRIYSQCTLCGKWHNEDLGFRIDFHITRNQGGYRVDLCKGCLKKVEPTLQQLFSIVDRSDFREDTSEIGLLCQKEVNSMFAELNANKAND